MAEAIETLEVVDRSGLPEELSDYDSFGKNKQGRFVGFREGEAKVIQGVGDVLGSTLLMIGAVKEVESEPDSPPIAELKARISQLEDKLETTAHSHDAQINKLRQEAERQLKERDDRINDLSEKVSDLTSKLQEKGVIDQNGDSRTKLITTPSTLGRGTLKDGVLIKDPPKRRPPVVVKERWQDRRGARIGALAVVAAVAAGAALIFSENGSNEHHPDHPRAEAIIPDNGYGTAGVLEANGYHLSYYNQARGRQVTGVWLPKNVNLVGSPGNYRIVKKGKTLVEHVEWDSQGKLKRTVMQKLRKNYNVAWGNLGGDRKISIVVNH